jgi:hypothetical protein
MVTTVAAHPQQAACFGDPGRSGNDGAPIGSTSPSELERPFGIQESGKGHAAAPFSRETHHQRRPPLDLYPSDPEHMRLRPATALRGAQKGKSGAGRLLLAIWLRRRTYSP